jgi:hypothetical protein
MLDDVIVNRGLLSLPGIQGVELVEVGGYSWLAEPSDSGVVCRPTFTRSLDSLFRFVVPVAEKELDFNGVDFIKLLNGWVCFLGTCASIGEVGGHATVSEPNSSSLGDEQLAARALARAIYKLMLIRFPHLKEVSTNVV